MMKIDLKDARNRAQGVVPGDVTETELKYARSILRNATGDVGAALEIVGRCGDENDAELVEYYLNSEEFRDVYGESALKLLCRHMGLITRYEKFIRECVFSDEYHKYFYNSRGESINLSDIYVENNQYDTDFMCRILNIYLQEEDENCGEARWALVKILNLDDKLIDRFGLKEESSLDRERIVSAAREKFGCAPPKSKMH
jgi:hypothetical protein